MNILFVLRSLYRLSSHYILVLYFQPIYYHLIFLFLQNILMLPFLLLFHPNLFLILLLIQLIFYDFFFIMCLFSISSIKVASGFILLSFPIIFIYCSIDISFSFNISTVNVDSICKNSFVFPFLFNSSFNW